nr:ABC transporter permease [Tissierella carlieri]
MYVLILIYSNPYTKYIFERLLMMIFVIFGVTWLVFTILYLSPMDPAINVLGQTATPDQVAEFNRINGLDKPYYIQLFNTFKSLITFNLGKSYVGNEDVLAAIMRKFPITLQLTFASLIIAVAIAIPAGIISAIKQYSSFDYIFMLVALLGLSIPTFWMGLILILNFSIKMHLLPATFILGDWKTLIMPSVVLGTSLAATVARMTRSSMLEVKNMDYIVTARAKGLSEGKVITKHILGNAMIPIVTVIGLQFGGMLGGSAVTEKVFNINGIGSFIVDKQFIPDIPIVLAGVVYVAVIISLANLVVDIMYSFLDPRIKSKMKSY